MHGVKADRRRGTYVNVVLTVIAVLLGLHLVRQADPSGSAALAAQRGTPPAPSELGIPNAGAQRLQMIRYLERLDQRMTAIESALTKGELTVKVIEMPEVRLAE